MALTKYVGAITICENQPAQRARESIMGQLKSIVMAAVPVMVGIALYSIAKRFIKVLP